METRFVLRRVRCWILLGPCFAPKIHDKIITDPAFTRLVDPVLSTTYIDYLGPGSWTALLVTYLTMVSNMDILFLPGRLVMFIVACPNPEIRQPLVNVPSFKATFDLEPTVAQEMLCFIIGQMCVRSGRGDSLVYLPESLRRSIMGQGRFIAVFNKIGGLDGTIRPLDRIDSVSCGLTMIYRERTCGWKNAILAVMDRLGGCRA